MKPLLAHVYEPHRVTYPCYVQPKLNGIRALYKGGHFQSRDEIPFPDGLLDHLAKPLLEVFGKQHYPLDGELYVHGWSLQRINSAVTPVATRRGPSVDTLEVEYHVFDVVDFSRSFIVRNTEPPVKPGRLPQVFKVPTCRVENESEANRFYAYWVSQGYEGMMYRIGECPYTFPKQIAAGVSMPGSRLKFLSDKDNRAWHLLKRKSWMDEDFICVGVEEGEGKYVGMTGALKCLCSKGDFTVSSGLSDMQRDKYWDHPELVIGKKIKVKFLCYSDDGIPLNPTILLIP